MKDWTRVGTIGPDAETRYVVKSDTMGGGDGAGCIQIANPSIVAVSNSTGMSRGDWESGSLWTVTLKQSKASPQASVLRSSILKNPPADGTGWLASGTSVLQQRFNPMLQRQALLYLSVLFCRTPSVRSVYNINACPSSRSIKHSGEPSLLQDTWFEIVQWAKRKVNCLGQS